MWRALRGAPLLTGFRGAPPADTGALEDLLLRLGRLAEDLPDVAELDLNPVLAGPQGCTGVDVKLRLTAVDTEPESYVTYANFGGRPAEPVRCAPGTGRAGASGSPASAPPQRP